MNGQSNVWIVGDVQGCCGSLRELLAQPDIAQDSDARFWFAGDLVNRGPQSLETLNLIHGMGGRAVAVLDGPRHLLVLARRRRELARHQHVPGAREGQVHRRQHPPQWTIARTGHEPVVELRLGGDPQLGRARAA